MSSPRFKRLDVRPLLERGEEPFPVIRRAVDELGERQTLVLRVSFLPSPLIELLGSEGFRSRIERCEGGDWVVFFWREPEDRSP